MKVIKFGRTRVIVANLTGFRPQYFKEKDCYCIQFDTVTGKTYTAFIGDEKTRDEYLEKVDSYICDPEADEPLIINASNA